jgi:hypothetical protein
MIVETHLCVGSFGTFKTTRQILRDSRSQVAEYQQILTLSGTFSTTINDTEGIHDIEAWKHYDVCTYDDVSKGIWLFETRKRCCFGDSTGKGVHQKPYNK